jgi:putative transposase
MKFAFIRSNEGTYEVDEMCSALGISRSGYYAWRDGSISARRIQDKAIKPRISRIHSLAKGRYGHRPIHSHLRDEGISCGRDRVLRLMRDLGVAGSQAKRFKPLGTDSNHRFGYSPNLLRNREAPTQKDEVWVADTTYLLTRTGWMYLATVMDLFSRRIIGWSVSTKNDTDLACAALKAAAGTRGSVRPGIIHHSDRGSTYASYEYQNLLLSLGLVPSMSAKGNCYDNAAMESFFGRFKTSTVRNRVFTDDGELRSTVFEYVEVFYNRFRKHSSLGYKSPIQYEEFSAPPMGGNHKAEAFTNN